MLGSFGGRRARLIALSFVMLLVACLEKGRAPAASQGSLTPDLAERSPTDGGKFRVVFASPRGETEEGGEISVVFDRSLRALERADLTPPTLTITPAVVGVVRWVGTRAVSFRPASGSLPSATEFRVELPATTRALDGSTLGSAFSFSFRTPRPKLVNAEPSSGQTGVLPTASLELFFNQAVAPATVQ